LKRKNDVVIQADKTYMGTEVDVLANDQLLLSGTLSQQGNITVGRRSMQGKAIIDAIASGKTITLRVR